MTPTIAQTSLPADWRDLLALTKPGVVRLVVFTGLCGLLAAPVMLPPVLGFTAVLCIALGAGAAGALNQWYEADLDAKMRRTANRPLPARRMDSQTALHFGVGLAVFSVVLMDSQENLHSFLRREVQSVKKEQRSLMPAYGELLTAKELEDLLSYLAGLGREGTSQ